MKMHSLQGIPPPSPIRNSRLTVPSWHLSQQHCPTPLCLPAVAHKLQNAKVFLSTITSSLSTLGHHTSSPPFVCAANEANLLLGLDAVHHPHWAKGWHSSYQIIPYPALTPIPPTQILPVTFHKLQQAALISPIQQVCPFLLLFLTGYNQLSLFPHPNPEWITTKKLDIQFHRVDIREVLL